MGEAILCGIQLLQDRKRFYKLNGLHYFRPWLFLITDGGPTDQWHAAAEKIKQGEESKSFAFFAVGVEGANFDVLRQISVRKPLVLRGLRFREMFVWLSRSQRAVSQSSPGQEDTVKFTSPTGPDGWAGL